MRELTAILPAGDPDEGGFWATCLEVPGANGQGETRKECLKSLAEAVQWLLETVTKVAKWQDSASPLSPRSGRNHKTVDPWNGKTCWILPVQRFTLEA